MTTMEPKPAMAGNETGCRKVWTTPTIILSEMSKVTADCSTPEVIEHNAGFDALAS